MGEHHMDRRNFIKGAAATGAFAASGTLIACSTEGSFSTSVQLPSLDSSQKQASSYTKEINDQVYALLDFDNETEKEFATRGLLAAPEALEIVDENGKLIWSQKAYAFLEREGNAPDTANPSLWRNAQLNHIFGLFEVVEGIYQIRGYDMTNITFIAGDSGWIVFDPLMSVECASAAMKLLSEHLGERSVSAVVMSHPHVDHYGGIKGVISEEEVLDRNIPIIVPQGFAEHAVAENIYAGNAMGRRAGYQYGAFLEQGAQGSLSIGIGLGQSKGTISYIAPNDVITKTGEIRIIDGVTMEFQMTPGTEAPAEMNTWFPDKKALWVAENCTATLHNLYTLRGAEIRDGNAWANYIMEAKARYGAEVEVSFQSHNWPHWGNDFVNEYLVNTAAMYKFIADQTLMYLNQGLTSSEIAHSIKLPEALEKNWYTRQYYGTVAHDARAVYQKYMGWYDANPINLNILPPSETAAKFVEYFGNIDTVLTKAAEDFQEGEYQWVAQITNMIVFADPQNKTARLLCADALEQLAYQAESGTWRNAYLSGAKELREGTVKGEEFTAKAGADTLRAMSPEMMLDYLGILLDANAAQDLNLDINLAFTDEEPYVLSVRSGVVLYQKGLQLESVDATLTLPRLGMFGILSRDKNIQAGIKVEGDQAIIEKLTEHLVSFDHFFNIVEP